MLWLGLAAWLLQTAANPFPETSASIEAGRRIYVAQCTQCHDAKGKPVVPAEPGATKPADLTRPKDWVHGMSAAAMFETLREGTEEMAGFKGKLRDEEIWRVIIFVRSLWPEDLRRSAPQD